MVSLCPLSNVNSSVILLDPNARAATVAVIPDSRNVRVSPVLRVASFNLI